ncbi:MAG: hypothetical protein EA367_00065, partial [Leptolyngbya sp. DLM2.Bin15]
ERLRSASVVFGMALAIADWCSLSEVEGNTGGLWLRLRSASVVPCGVVAFSLRETFHERLRSASVVFGMALAIAEVAFPERSRRERGWGCWQDVCVAGYL